MADTRGHFEEKEDDARRNGDQKRGHTFWNAEGQRQRSRQKAHFDAELRHARGQTQIAADVGEFGKTMAQRPRGGLD